MSKKEDLTKVQAILINIGLNAVRTVRGGYTKNDLAKLGVPWPPVKGWKEKILNGETEPLD